MGPEIPIGSTRSAAPNASATSREPQCAGLPGELHPGRPATSPGNVCGRNTAGCRRRPRRVRRADFQRAGFGDGGEVARVLVPSWPCACQLGCGLCCWPVRRARRPQRGDRRLLRRLGRALALHLRPCGAPRQPRRASRARCAALRGPSGFDHRAAVGRASANSVRRRSGTPARPTLRRGPGVSSKAAIQSASWRSLRARGWARRLGVDLHHRALHLAGQQVERRERFARWSSRSPRGARPKASSARSSPPRPSRPGGLMPRRSRQ